MSRGHLIVFEGIDGSGTTTQASALRKAFVQRGLPAHLTAHVVWKDEKAMQEFVSAHKTWLKRLRKFRRAELGLSP